MTWRELFIGLLLMGIKWRFDPRTQTALPNEHFKVGSGGFVTSRSLTLLHHFLISST